MRKKIVLLGCTGLIGKALCSRLAKEDYDLSLVVRKKSSPKPPHINEQITWVLGDDPKELRNSLEGCFAVINLSGEPIFQYWSKTVKKKLADSRILLTKNLASFIDSLSLKPSLWINASAIGYYGDGGEQGLTEESPVGKDYLANLCQAWEGAVFSQGRTVTLRIGLVLSREGELIRVLKRVFKWYLGTIPGKKNWLSWIHLDDLVESVIHILEKDEIRGPVNIVSPQPVRAEHFYGTFAKALRRPLFPSPPELLIKFILRDQAGILLNSQRVQAGILEQSGFNYSWDTIEKAIEDVLS